jgi:uridylate kinase
MNALFLMQFFGKEANQSLPKEMKEVKARLPKNKVIICGALRFLPQSTSDSTAARLAHYLKTEFINMTNVAGLYSADPRTHKDAKFIQKISWKDFEKKAKVLAYKPGQHFVLDQQAAMVIRKHKIRTIILGKDLRELENVINHKSFKGTVIEG